MSGLPTNMEITLIPRARTLALVAALVVGLALVATVGVATLMPSGACASCHAMRSYAISLGGSPHKGVDCVGCHAPSPAVRVALAGRVLGTMVPRAVLGDGSVTGPGRGVGDTGCVECHEQSLGTIPTSRGLRVLHSACAQGASCVSCHGRTAHGDTARVQRTYVMEECVACHRAKSAPTACDTCHLPRGERERVRTGPWQTTHGPLWRKTHGMGSLRFCATCHPSDYCVKCHGTPLPHDETFGSTHGAAAKRDLAACTACHDLEKVCTSCHGMPMPHEKGYLKVHSAKATSVNDPKCSKCHRVGDCIFCHVRHIHTGNTRITPDGGAR